MENNCISRKNAEKTAWMILEGLGYHKSDNSELEATVKAVYATCPTADVQPVEWISVEDRLPEEEKYLRFHVDGLLSFTTVLVYTKHGQYAIANRLKHDPCGSPYLDEYATNGWIWSKGSEGTTHWMPLPEPPEGAAGGGGAE